jgi:hypothetical protein
MGCKLYLKMRVAVTGSAGATIFSAHIACIENDNRRN